MTRRDVLKTGGALTAAGVAGLYAPAVIGQSKPFDGVTLNVSCWSAPYPKWLADYLPKFEDLTGAKVNYDTPGFPIYNQRVDLELSTQGSAYDVLNITFIYTSRWIGAGWFEPLQPYLDDPEKTPPDWEPADFLPGAVAPLKDSNGVIHGLPWIADAYMGAAGRFDLLEQAGLGMPDTFDEIVAMCQAVNDQDGVKAFVNENHHGWTWIPYLHGFGGDVFAEPPDNLMPTLDTPEAIAAAEYYARLLKEFSPDGVLSYTYDQSLNTLKQGCANYTTFNQAWLVQLGDAETSKVGEHGQLLADAAGPGRPLSGRRLARLGHPGRLQKQGRRLGVHQVGDVEGADGADADREGLRLADPALDHRQRRVQGEDDGQRPRRRQALRRHHRSRLRRSHGVSHGPRLSAGRQADRQGDREHRLGPDVGERGLAAGSGKLDRRPQARRHQALSRK
jgi:multiple sugar transport system substrate-binding protein